MHNSLIKNLIANKCKSTTGLPELLEFMSGIDPISLQEVISEMVSDGELIISGDKWHSKTDKMLVEHGEAKAARLPSVRLNSLTKRPHPLDYEWRHTDQANQIILELISNDIQNNQSILLLGMPTLYAQLASLNLTNKVQLIDFNGSVMEELNARISIPNFSIICEDIFELGPEQIGKFGVVIMDPPWYTEHFQQFVWLASNCMTDGGYQLISLPALFTRPDAPRERIDLLRFCLDCGVVLEELMARKIQYEMPFFEFCACKAAGLQQLDLYWRRGDLAKFRKIAACSVVSPSGLSVRNGWQEFILDNVRIRVLDNDISLNGDFSVQSIVDGDVLPSVSSRDARRQHANVWTSSNRIYKVHGTDLLIKELRWQSVGAITSEAIREFIKSIVDSENNEYRKYTEWVNL